LVWRSVAAGASLNVEQLAGGPATPIAHVAVSNQRSHLRM
jgi:hypothetical protein